MFVEVGKWGIRFLVSVYLGWSLPIFKHTIRWEITFDSCLLTLTSFFWPPIRGDWNENTQTIFIEYHSPQLLLLASSASLYISCIEFFNEILKNSTHIYHLGNPLQQYRSPLNIIIWQFICWPIRSNSKYYSPTSSWLQPLPLTL